jgi:hypothetical protein
MFKNKFIEFYDRNLDKFNFLIVIICWMISFGMLIFSLLIMKGKYNNIYDGTILNDSILYTIGVLGYYISILSLYLSMMASIMVYESYRYAI